MIEFLFAAYATAGCLIFWIITGAGRNELRGEFKRGRLTPGTFAVASVIFILTWPIGVAYAARHK